MTYNDAGIVKVHWGLGIRIVWIPRPPFSDSLSKQILSELFVPRGLDNRTQKYTLWRSSHSFLSNSLILINWPFFLDIKMSRYLVGLLMIR